MTGRPPQPADAVEQLRFEEDSEAVPRTDPEAGPAEDFATAAAPEAAPADEVDPAAEQQPDTVRTQVVDAAAEPDADRARSVAAPSPAVRTSDAILARVHLRGGLIALARAELEQMAGAGTLDTPALADLAESRWRSGDLAGAADAAHAHLDAGGEEPMALLIAAEALDAEGHLIDARALAARVLERVGGHVDRLFAGERRSSAWSTAGSMPTPLPSGTVAWGALAGGREVGQPALGTWTAAPEPESQPPVPGADETAAPSEPQTGGSGAVPFVPLHGRATIAESVDAGRAAGRELDAVEAAIAAGRLAGVPERLALLLRVDRALAPVILSHADQALAVATGDDATAAALHLVRGDAFRSLGHEAEANAAYQQSLRALAVRATTEETT